MQTPTPQAGPRPVAAAAPSDSSSESESPEASTEEPYYWEEGGDPHPPATKLVSHNFHWLSTQLFTGVEFVGEQLSEFFGMFNSRYEWAVQMEQNRLVGRRRWSGRVRIPSLLIAARVRVERTHTQLGFCT